MTEERGRTGLDRCYEHLKRQLLHGQIAPGQRLAEVEWSRRLGVHRQAVQETLCLLCHEGLLRRGTRGGHFVPRYSPADLAEVVEVRLILEIGALRVMQMAGGAPAHLAEMRRLNEVMATAHAERMDLTYLEADRRFHELLIASAGNSRLTNVYVHAPLPLLMAENLDEETRLRERAAGQLQHEQLVEMLERTDFDEACDLLREHLLRVWRRCMDQIGRLEHAVS